MYTLLIADDESIIRESLSSLIDWKAHGFELVGTAKDGREIVDYLKANGPVDAILTDIQMRDMSGLEIAAYVAAHAPQTKVIIISGYREFEYARKAISFGVSQYLLKPLDLHMIDKAFTNLKAELDKTASERSSRLRQQTELRQYRRAATENFFELLRLGLFHKLEDAQLYLRKFQLDEALNGLHCYSFRLDADVSPEEQGVDTDVISGIFLSAYADRSIFYSCSVGWQAETQYDILLAARSSIPVEMFCGYCQTVSHNFEKKTGIRVLLRPTAQDLTLAEWITRCQKNLSGATADSLLVTAQQYLSILNATNEGEQAAKVLSDIFLSSTLQASPEEAMRMVRRFSDQMAQLLEVNGAALCPPEEEQSMTPRQFFETTIKNAHLLLKKKEMQQISVSDAVKKMIAERIDENISLHQAAAEFFISPNYLSRLFKEQTGMNFSEYTIQIKLDKAAELLGSSEKKVYEISEYLGYKSLQYFYKLFRRGYGCTPTEYRETMLRGNEKP